MSDEQPRIIEGSTYHAIAIRHDRWWGHGIDVRLYHPDGAELGMISFACHPEFDDYELFQAKSTEQLLSIVDERLEQIVIECGEALQLGMHILVRFNSPQALL